MPGAAVTMISGFGRQARGMGLDLVPELTNVVFDAPASRAERIAHRDREIAGAPPVHLQFASGHQHPDSDHKWAALAMMVDGGSFKSHLASGDAIPELL